ncbi:dimethyl sulfoxide reductase anchor subunit family protein [Tranquillimonas rosea]|uniref:dimethyl sulfoxide reductase anchor subunit family protein n=1 Tax=Tranquillimonas rosea TaxID=641238 RepID=UPI003BACA4DB
MKPAASLLAFTTLSGLGLGLLVFLSLGLPPVSGWGAFAFFAISFLLAGGGLSISALHLGRPERALKAFREWRTSWLSREAWASVTALGLTGLYALPLLFDGPRLWPIGILAAAACIATVVCTGSIYAALRAVPRWHHWSTPAMFVAYAVTGGALLAGQVTMAMALLAATGIAQFLAWRTGDARVARRFGTRNTATGLHGHVRLFERPHTGENYVTEEMVFLVARKHATKLRSIALVLAFALPLVLLALPFSHVLGVAAVLSHAAGVVVARWLFFAEAEHVVGLYYGR